MGFLGALFSDRGWLLFKKMLVEMEATNNEMGLTMTSWTFFSPFNMGIYREERSVSRPILIPDGHQGY